MAELNSLSQSTELAIIQRIFFARKQVIGELQLFVKMINVID